MTLYSSLSKAWFPLSSTSTTFPSSTVHNSVNCRFHFSHLQISKTNNFNFLIQSLQTFFKVFERAQCCAKWQNGCRLFQHLLEWNPSYPQHFNFTKQHFND